MQPSFEWLIDPIAPSTFFSEYYERQPLLIEREQSTKWASLLSLEGIDHYLSTTTPCHPDVFLVDAARDLKADDYSFADTRPLGRIDLTRVYQLFATGATISLSQMHERVAPLADLCRMMEKVFSSHFQTNIYLSPPNAQGFKTHFDSHDVFVLQVSGSKTWTLYDTAIVLPLHGQVFDPDKHSAGPPTQEFTLHAGDLFYCPRGLFHSARSTDETSLHITLGLIGKTWADLVMEAVSAACLETPALRANLPIGYANAQYDPREAEETFRNLLEGITRNAQFAPILERVATDFVTSRRPALDGCLAKLGAPLTQDCHVAPRPDLIYLLREEEKDLIVLFGATEIRLPKFVRSALQFALESNEFAVGDVPGLEDSEKIVLIERLLKEGLLMRKDSL